MCFRGMQFYYGEDGVDVLQTSYLRQFGFLAENAPRFAQQLDLHHAVAASETMGIARQEAAAQKAVRWASHAVDIWGLVSRV